MRMGARLAIAAGVCMVALAMGVVPAAGAGRGPVVRADPTVGASPTPSATATPSPLPSQACAYALTLPTYGPADRAYGPGSGVVGTTTITNTSAYTFFDAYFSVELGADRPHPDRGAPPTVMWSLDGGAWQPIANLTATTDPPPPGSPYAWISDDMPLGDLQAGATHTMHFWLRFGPGVVQANYIVQATINAPACQFPLASRQVLEGFYLVQTAPPGHVSVPAATGPPAIGPVPRSTPVPTPAPTLTPADTPPLSAEPVDDSIGTTDSGWGVRRTGGLAAGLALAGLGVRMAVAWWWARRRIRP
jgi:hypothetical protein